MPGWMKSRGQRNIISRDGKTLTLSCGHVQETDCAARAVERQSVICKTCRRTPGADLRRTCSSCKVNKPIDDFYFLNKERVQRAYNCKPCADRVTAASVARRKAKRTAGLASTDGAK